MNYPCYFSISEKYNTDCINIPMTSLDKTYQITSPGYPLNHQRSLDMCWIVFVPDGSHVPELVAKDSQLEDAAISGCHDYIAVYDGG